MTSHLRVEFFFEDDAILLRFFHKPNMRFLHDSFVVCAVRVLLPDAGLVFDDSGSQRRGAFCGVWFMTVDSPE